MDALPGISRREWLNRCGHGLGAIALADLLASDGRAAGARDTGILGSPHFPPRAKRVIFLFQSGGPSHLETFDYKPALNERQGEQLPDSVRQGQRLTSMSAYQTSIPLAGSMFKFSQHGKCGAWFSELLPHMATVADELCFIKSMYTEAINHDPAITFFQTGSQLAGRPSVGAWLNYGLGSDNSDLPAFVVLVTAGKKRDQPLYSRLWGSGFLPSKYQGVRFHSGKDPVLYLSNPPGLERDARKDWLDRWRELQMAGGAAAAEPSDLEARISQYEMAFEMQASIPSVADTSDEPAWVFDLYGPDSRKPGSYASNCLLARRLAERGVKFIQVYHQGWDQHGNLPKFIREQTSETDQASAALVRDLKDRGLLEDTLVVWGGEFGRTCYSQGVLTAAEYGRDHHPRCFTFWMAGAGVKPGYTHGETCEFGYNIVREGVHVHDFQATILHLLGIDHERLVYLHQGRYFRLTDVHGQVVHDILT
jgi:hypothetical protein